MVVMSSKGLENIVLRERSAVELLFCRFQTTNAMVLQLEGWGLNNDSGRMQWRINWGQQLETELTVNLITKGDRATGESWIGN
jgi:hypothetical protein